MQNKPILKHILSFLGLLLKIKSFYPFERAGTNIFDKIKSVYEFIIRIFRDIHKLKKICGDKTISKLDKLKDFLFELIETYKTEFIRINHFNLIIDEIRDIFHNEDLPEKESLKKLRKITVKVSYWSENINISENYRKGYEKLFKTIKSWRKKLFVFKNYPIIPATNNSLENFFKEKKSWMRRTSGVKFGNKTFSLYGEYIIFVDTTWSLNQIKEFLQNANYEETYPKIQLEKQKSHKRKLLRDKLKNWDNDFKEKSQKLILSLQL